MLRFLTSRLRPARRRGDAMPAARSRYLPAADARAWAQLLLDDCDDFQGRQLHARVAAAESLEDLWHLRPNVYQCIALRHGEHEARHRLRQVEEQVEEATAA